MSLFTGASAIAAAIATGTATTIAAKTAAGANKNAAATQAAATTHAADLQQQANDAALAFQRQEAEAAYQSAESTRRANYDQWAAQQRRYSAIGDLVGLAPREIPGYVAQPDPRYTGGGAPAAAASAGGGLPSLGGTFDPQRAAAAYAIAYPGRPFDAGYWAGVWPGLVARGAQLNDPDYATKRLMGYEAGGGDVALAGPFAGGAGAPRTAGAEPRASYSAIGDYLVPGAPVPMTSPLAMPTPRNSYAAIGAYV